MNNKNNDFSNTNQFKLQDISIKAKLISLTMLSMLVLSIILATVSIDFVKQTLIQQKYTALTAARDSKIKQLKDIFKLYKKQIGLLSATSYGQELAKEFTQIHQTLGIDENGKFNTNNDLVQKALPKWDAFYKKYTQTYPFEDIYLISAQYGHVLYTYKKFPDFGTNLNSGDYRKSGLAKIWKKVRKYKRTVLIDMSSYAPRDGKPSMFIAAPLFVNSELTSVLVFRLKNENLKNIMQLRSGYGKTQEDYLVGKDYLMRSDSFLSPQTHSLSNSFKNPESGKATTPAVTSAFNNITDTQIIKDYNGNDVLSSYTLFNIDDELDWAVLSEIDLNEILEKSNRLRDTLTVITFITFLIIMMLFYFIIQKYVINSLNIFQNGLLNFFDYLNGESKEIVLLNDSSKDEIGIMSSAVNDGIEKTRINLKDRDSQNWIKNGVNELNQILINMNSVQQVTAESIKFIGNYINAGVGVFYLHEQSDETLLQYASFAHIVRDELSAEFKIGEGLIGQVALQKSPILLTNIKKDQLTITTGTITQESFNTYTFPLIYNDILYGVIEIGSFEQLSSQIIEFLNAIDKTICISLASAIQNKKVQELLDKTKLANDELTTKQEELEVANKYMQQQQQDLEEANANMEEQQQQLEEANANMEEQQQQLKISEQNLKLQNQQLEDTKKEIQEKADELEKSGQYKSEFLANMSHELRTPLNSIILLSSLLHKNSKDTLTHHDVKKAKTIFDSGNELLRLINDILDLSKVESGKMEVIVDSFRSDNFLIQMKDIFDFTAADKGLDFIIIDEYENMIHSDKDRISQIVRNLVSNAFKFTQKGSITLKIAPSKKQDKEIELAVIDTGIGIPTEKQDLIFKAFTQADGSTSREYGGTGLGLSISRELAKLLGGEITVTSQEEKGSTFSIDLPLLKPMANQTPKIEEKFTSKINKEQPPKEIQKKVLPNDDRDTLSKKDEAYLIIDDDKTFADIVYEEIKKDNSFGLVAYDAKSGLDLVKNYNIKGIMLDLTLPDMDGVDVLKELKSNNHSRHIPVHVISSKDKNSQTLELGAIGYLQKPVYDGDINEVISNIDSFKQKKIKDLLIVEDDKVHREALIELVGEGVNIVGVKTASEAIQEVKKEIYDTVVVDLGLMAGSGYEVCEYIKNSHPKLPIIIYTGRDLSNDDKIKLQAYSNSVIIKTANSNERILNEINLFLHRDKSEDKINETEAFQKIDLEHSNILIVDDDIKNIFVLEAALQEFSANTFTAFNGKEALDFLETNKKIDLILMDIMMPVMDGYEAIQKIREDEEIKHIPIIAVTAKAMKEDREKCIRFGADDYMSKPINLNILGGLIEQWSLKKHK